MIEGVTHIHLGAIWYLSEPSDVPYFQNQFPGWDFFYRFLQQDSSSYSINLVPFSWISIWIPLFCCLLYQENGLGARLWPTYSTKHNTMVISFPWLVAQGWPLRSIGHQNIPEYNMDPPFCWPIASSKWIESKIVANLQHATQHNGDLWRLPNFLVFTICAIFGVKISMNSH